VNTPDKKTTISLNAADASAPPAVPGKVGKPGPLTLKSSKAKAPASPKAAAPAAAPVAVAEPKPGRRSAVRTAAPATPPVPMLPTHAPDAAKASYSTMPERLMTPSIQPAAPKDPKLANNWKSKPADQLTDEEIKSMPDDEYMNEVQLAFFRHKLSVLKQEIHNSAGETTEHLREDAAIVPDPADRATIEEEHALELRTRDRERKLLKKIEQSIASIDSGDYGYCDETGEPIGVGRLIARPTANLSLEAQQRRELKQKMFGD
jgi:DnaK suppressor protein